MMDPSKPNTTDLAVIDQPVHGSSSRIRYVDKNEPLDSPGIVPAHLKRGVTAQHPLLEILQRLVHRLQPGTNLEIVLAAIALYKASQPVYEFLKNLLGRLLTSQVTVSEYDPIGREILAYMSANVMSKSTNTKAMLVTSNGSQDLSDNYMREYMMARYAQKAKETDEIRCMPPIGKKIFWVGFRPFLFSRTAQYQANTSRYPEGHSPVSYTISLTTLGWSLKPLQDFVKICHDFKVASSGETTTVFFCGTGVSGYDAYGGGSWRSVTKAIRKMDTIDIDEHVKTDLIQDAEEYYSTESKKFYADVGIPFRRGYLFHGPPGTGKTSFSSALAGHLKCDIYMINLASPDVNDGKLHSLFLSLPRKCVVVIEDIDSAGIVREQEKSAEPYPLTQPLGTLDDRALPLPVRQQVYRRRGTNVTLSGLLNAIDGNASQEGRLLIMTSNNPDSLDEALTRPGRIDKKIHFSNLSEASARGIFERLIGRAAISSGKQTPAEIKQKAELFARKLPEGKFTPAQVQNFLQFCRGDADRALVELDDWVNQQLKTKKAKSEMSTKAPPKTNGVDPSAPPPMPDTMSSVDAAALFSDWMNGSTSDLTPERAEETARHD